MLEMIEASRSELIDLCDRYGVRRLALFGSALRDDFDPGRSDLDLLVEFSPTSPQEHAEAYFGLLENLESLFGRRVDLLELGAVRNPYLRREIEEQQETLYAAA
ncbi:MAG: nucleotidyltransferase domain-containing protein [Actinomycetota bacterium]|nr:nucleotidyltransferase domain-containing protein [Actinomycetota bacterium]